MLLLAGSLALATADLSTVGAMTTELKSSLNIDNTGVGLLVSVPSAVGALTTLPFGILTDRVNRTRLLAWSAALWSAIMLACALAPSFLLLLLFRLGLGASVAAAGPLVASLTGTSSLRLNGAESTVSSSVVSSLAPARGSCSPATSRRCGPGGHRSVCWQP